MKKLIFIFFLIPALGFSQPVTDGLVGYWPFNGHANDESGNGNDGTVTGPTLTTDSFGKANSAYSFDGVNDYISIQDTDQLTFINGNEDGSFSISCWINPEINNSGRAIVSKWDQYDIGVEYILYIAGNEKLRFQVENENSSSKRLVIESENIIEYDIWQHITAVYDGSMDASGLKLYLNGTLLPTINLFNDSDYNGMKNTPQNFWIGKHISRNGSNHFFKGGIDEVMIFNKTLDDQEIQSVYTGSSVSYPQLCGTLYCDGENIGIGTPNTQGYKLAVAGDFIAQKVKVALQDQWPDYVFDEDYDLQDLQQLEQYIKTHGHLPNIPDADVIEKNGYELSDMDAKLLEKIEELSLYIIHQNKINQEQKKKIEALEGQNEQLKSQQREIELLKQRLNKLEN